MKPTSLSYRVEKVYGAIMNGLEGQVALVTGAGRRRGIGRAIALRLAEEGSDVIVAEQPRHPDTFPQHEREVGWLGARSVADEIRQMGRRALPVSCDVTSVEDVEKMVADGVSHMGHINILVNNAAIPSGSGSAAILDMEDELWYRTVDVNLNGLYLVTKHVGRALRESGGGSVINISSTGGRQGAPNQGAYCATKWAVIGLTQQLAYEWARFNIRVNCICPGTTDTDMMDGTIERRASHAKIDEDTVRARLLSAVPMRRPGLQSEQAAAVAFLASSDASYITGQTLNVDGGLRMD